MRAKTRTLLPRGGLASLVTCTPINPRDNLKVAVHVTYVMYKKQENRIFNSMCKFSVKSTTIYEIEICNLPVFDHLPPSFCFLSRINPDGETCPGPVCNL